MRAVTEIIRATMEVMAATSRGLSGLSISKELRVQVAIDSGKKQAQLWLDR